MRNLNEGETLFGSPDEGATESSSLLQRQASMKLERRKPEDRN